jgi:transketolase
VPELHAALERAREVTDRPSFIVLRTLIAWPAPHAQGTGKAHGSALGEEEVAATKEILGFDPAETFEVSTEVLTHTRSLVERGKDDQAAWEQDLEKWKSREGTDLALWERLQTRALPDELDDALPRFDADAKGMATRKASGAVINAIAGVMPELWGGSADLAESNNTTIEGAPSFIPADRSTDQWSGDPYQGRVLHFGIREHGMGGILNGITLHGGTRVFGGTFLQFSDYMRGSVRLAALMGLPVIYVWTHDSIGLGEDGPTHQPIEHLAALRAIPGLDVVRPGDANEVAACWKAILQHTDRPAGLALTRQNIPVFPRGEDAETGERWAGLEDVSKGGYVLLDTDGGQPDVVLIGTGSELQVAVAARELLADRGVRARVVSMPCREWFDEQDPEYRESVLPPIVKARVSVEAGVPMGWRELVGDHGRIVGIDQYGASANYERIYTEYGITAEAVADAAQDSIRVANV